MTVCAHQITLYHDKMRGYQNVSKIWVTWISSEYGSGIEHVIKKEWLEAETIRRKRKNERLEKRLEWTVRIQNI